MSTQYSPVGAQGLSPAARTRWWWNTVAGAVQLVTALNLLALTDRDATVPTYTFYADPHTRERPHALGGWGPQPERRFEWAVGYLSGAFLLLSALYHVSVATWLAQCYEDCLALECNPLRWLEYSMSASLMHVLIAYLCGVMDLHLQLCVFGLTATTMALGALQELQPRAGKTLWPFVLGCVPHLFGWAVLCSYFFYGVSHGSPPAFVWSIIFVEFALDNAFAVWMLVGQYPGDLPAWLCCGRRRLSYETVELGFIVLSLSAKQLLAWLNWGGTRALSK